MTDERRAFLENRDKLIQICQDQRDNIDLDIIKIVDNVQIVNSQHLLSCLKQISVV